MPILVDFNQIAMANISSARDEFRDGVTVGIVRHMILKQLLFYKNKFKEYGDPVICRDSGTYWRKEKFPYYKARRQEAKAKDPVDWKFIYECINTVGDEIQEYVPWKVVREAGAEGDDVISVITRWHQENDLVQTGLEETPQKIMIASSDTDFVQLQKYNGVKQYSTIQKKMVRSDLSPEDFLIDHIITGDVGDGVPNILSQDDCFVMRIRQKPIRKEFKEMIAAKIKLGEDHIPEENLENYRRNKMLVDLIDSIPKDLEQRIANQYIEAKESRSTLLSYLIKFGMKNLMEDIEKF